MRKKRTLLLYKTSTYEYLERSLIRNSIEGRRFYAAHQRHYACLKKVEVFFAQNQLAYVKVCRNRPIRYQDFDILVTVGGDGTFLEAAHHATDQIVLGVNSDPLLSVGQFCSANPDNFPQKFNALLNDKAKLLKLNRFQMRLNKRDLGIFVLNDILICHANPAAMSHYYIQIGKVCEEQRSSGVWIATAAGSTGAIHSAGGRILPMNSQTYQYLPRELYLGWKKRFDLKGGLLPPGTKVEIRSLMREGVFYVDGAHQKFSFDFGQKLSITPARQPLKIVSP